MREFNTRTTKGDYFITFETDDRKAFEQVETLCEILIDGKDGDVIPVEWIKKYGVKIAKKCCHCATAIWEMLEDWEKENEENS